MVVNEATIKESSSVTVRLTEWQDRLSSHFTDLKNVRKTEHDERVLYAIEHGLSAAEIQALQRDIHEYITLYPPSGKHFLPWIVYSTEMGYQYSGDEYWQTFEEKTPYWTERGERHWIRDCYLRFRDEYNGAVPTGAWADQFRIIAWPITHAILPKDLQTQLAEILFNLRHSFSDHLFRTPIELGRLIARRGGDKSSRFKNFAQETELLGQISTALLLEGKHSGRLIYPPTLERISKDLENERKSRTWLQHAKRTAQEKVYLRGLDSGVEQQKSHKPSSETVRLGIEPRLLLIPGDVERASWEVYLEIPNLAHLVTKFPSLKEVLTNSRSSIEGNTGRPLARGAFIYGPSQRVLLSKWPKPAETLIKFENSDPTLDCLLTTECLLRPGNTWLFRIASDGLAYQNKCLNVRPGEKYILLTTEDDADNIYASRIKINCDGVQGVLLELPNALDKTWEESLKSFNLKQTKSIEVWPVGLPPLSWDGSGHGEWYSSEQPCIAVQCDHAWESLQIKLAADSLTICPVVPGKPVFIQFPRLPIGFHTATVLGKAVGIEEARYLGEIDILIRAVTDVEQSQNTDSSIEQPNQSYVEYDGQIIEWLVNAKTRKGQNITLIDNSSPEFQPTLYRYSFDRPAETICLKNSSQYVVPSDGGLYVARLGSNYSSLIVPPTGLIKDFSQLVCNPHIPNDVSITRILEAIDYWSYAHTQNAMRAKILQGEVLKELCRDLIYALCGIAWCNAEFDYQEKSSELEDLIESIPCSDLGKIKYTFFDDCINITDSPETALINCLEKAYWDRLVQSELSEDEVRWVIELALRLMSHPATVIKWSGSKLEMGLSILSKFPSLIRAARFAVITVDEKKSLNPDELSTGWAWE